MRSATAIGRILAFGISLTILGRTVAAQRDALPAPLATSVARSAECGAALASASRLLTEMPPPSGAEADEALAAAAKRGLSRADGYDALSAASMLHGEMPAAASASLQALTLEWGPRHATNLGIALMYLNRYDDAAGLLTCARELDPDLVFAIEAQAMLAHRRKNCSEATRLIGEAAARIPSDANVHYSTGVIRFKCGDRAGAAAELRVAVEIAPVDAVMVQALAVAGAGVPPPKPTPTPKAVRQKIDELFRFMDEAVAIAERKSHPLKTVALAMGQRDTKDVDVPLERLKQGIVSKKASVLQIEALTATLAPQMGPDVWNGLLDECIRTYFQTTMDLYRAREPGRGINQMILMGAALGQEPAALGDRARDNGPLIQGESTRYGKIVSANTNLPGVGINCPPIRSAYRVLVERVETNMNALSDGFPRAGADYINLWLSYAEQAADYAKRTTAVARFPATNASAGPAWTARIQSAYESMVHRAVLTDVAGFLRASQARASSEVSSASQTLVTSRLRECDEAPKEAASLADAIERLMEAFEKAGEYGASLTTPDCTIGIGPVKIACKPLAFEGVKGTWSGGPVKVSASAGDRWGVDGSVGPFSESSKGSRMNIATTKSEASYDGVKGEMSVSTWIEHSTSGKADAFVEVKGTLGLGVDAEGLGTVGCEFFNANAKFNLRAFAETLTR